MSQIVSRIITSSPDYKTNFAHNQQLVDELAERQQQAAYQRPQRTLDRQRKRDKLLVRERVEAILDKSQRVDYYVSLNFLVYSTDPKWGALMQKVTEYNSQINQKLVFFDLEWNMIDDERALAIMDDSVTRDLARKLARPPS